MPAFLVPALYLGATAALALLASGCNPSKEPPETTGNGPDEGPAGPDQQQKITAPAQAPAPANTFRALQRNNTDLLALDVDRVEKIFAQLCAGARESVKKDRASLTRENFKSEGVSEEYWPQVGQEPTDAELHGYYYKFLSGGDSIETRCKMISIYKTSNTWFKLAVVFENRNEPENAQQAYDVADAMGRLDGEAYPISHSMLVSARRYLNQGETFRALDLYEAILKLDEIPISDYYPRHSEELREKLPRNGEYFEWGREIIERLKAQEKLMASKGNGL